MINRPRWRAQRTVRLGLLLLCATLISEARAQPGVDLVSRKVSKALLAPALVPRASATGVHVVQPWRDGDRVHVYVRVRSTNEATLDALRQRGLEIIAVDAALGGIVDGWTTSPALPALAALPVVTMIRPVAPPITQAGAVVTAGDGLLRGPLVRATGFDGRGVVLGLISDGIDNAAASTTAGELPVVTVPPDPRCANLGGDEGTAMLEIVHDIAPGATLLFGSFGQGGVQMAATVRCLADAGSRVIVDDVTFGDEPFFQDGPLALAAREVVGRGVSYHTSAGNRRQEFLNQPVTPVNFGPPFGFVHDFGDGDVANEIVVGASATTTCALQWNEPFGAATTDLDLFIVQGSADNVLGQSTDTQDGTQDPLEMVSLSNPTDTDQTVSIVVPIFSGDPNRLLRLMCFRSRSMEHVSIEGAIYGQQSPVEVIAVGSIDVADPDVDNIESQSSPGPSIIFFPTPEVRQKPDLASFDGVETFVGQAGNFVNPFFGTSAACPHTGAVAALMLSKNPTLTPAQIQEIMKATSVDIEAPGFDSLAGAGRVDALGAVQAVPCLDANILPAAVSCSGEKVPRSVTGGYKAARGRLVAAATAPAPKLAKFVNAARKKLTKALTALGKREAKGKLSATCGASLRGSLSLAVGIASCRVPA